MCLVILPIAIIYVTICVDEATSTICFVYLPVAVIDATIGPDLMTAPMSLISLSVPFAIVFGAILQNELVLFHFLYARFIVLILIESVLEFR